MIQSVEASLSRLRTAVLDAVPDVARELEVKPAQVAIAWLLQTGRTAGATAVPIIGPRTQGQFEDYLAALGLELTPERLWRLSEVSAPDLGVPQ